MKKILVIFCLVGLAGSSFAQKATFGLKTGVNFSSLSVSSGSPSTTTGFNFGAFGDVPLSNRVSLQPGFFFIRKGGSVESNSTSGSVTVHSKEDLKLDYFEVPFNVLYVLPVGVGRFYVGGGPYVALGLSGTDKYSKSATGGSTSSSSSGEMELEFGNSATDVKNPDFGINFLGGIKVQNNLHFSIGYGLGLANLSNNNGTNTKNGSFSISVCYFFKSYL